MLEQLSILHLAEVFVRAGGLEEGVFAEIADDRRLRRLGMVLPALLIFPGTIATVLLYATLQGVSNMDLSETVFRQVVLGTVSGFGLWLFWMYLIGGGLGAVWGLEVNFGRLFGAAGFAAAPLVILWFYWIPERFDPGAPDPFADIALGLLVVAGVAWVAYTIAAVREAVPGASERQATLATLTSFVPVFAVFLYGGMHYATMPWISAFTRAARLYIG
jgi:hypothetical protein